jgi:hypothetical protein
MVQLCSLNEVHTGSTGFRSFSASISDGQHIMCAAFAGGQVGDTIDNGALQRYSVIEIVSFSLRHCPRPIGSSSQIMCIVHDFRVIGCPGVLYSSPRWYFFDTNVVTNALDDHSDHHLSHSPIAAPLL